MSSEIKVLRPQEKDLILALEGQNLEGQDIPDIEKELSSWHARWREESLNHYLALGWSFGVWQKEQLVGYFLAQPLLFFEGMTQSLWVEHLWGRNDESTEILIDLAYRTSREKHLQRVYFANSDLFAENLKKRDPMNLDNSVRWVKTSKIKDIV